MEIKRKLFNKRSLNAIFQMHFGQRWQMARREWVLFRGGARSPVWEERMTWAPP